MAGGQQVNDESAQMGVRSKQNVSRESRRLLVTVSGIQMLLRCGRVALSDLSFSAEGVKQVVAHRHSPDARSGK